MDINDAIVTAHKHCIANQEEIRESEQCGCFYCLRIFNPNEIVEWLNEKAGVTAFCPYCYIDAVIGSRSGYPLTPQFLGIMQKYWFDNPDTVYSSP